MNLLSSIKPKQLLSGEHHERLLMVQKRRGAIMGKPVRKYMKHMRFGEKGNTLKCYVCACVTNKVCGWAVPLFGTQNLSEGY